MTDGSQRAITLITWASLAAFAALQIVSWVMGMTPRYPWGVAQVAAGWIVMLGLGFLATHRVGRLSAELTQTANAHLATKGEVEQLQMLNTMLEILARTVDVPLAFQSLAQRIARLVSCDRVGLALLNDSGEEFQTYTARVSEVERRERPRAELVFKTDGTAIGAVVRTRQPLIVDDTSVGAPDFLDMNVTHSSGFASALVIPLVSNERAVGTLNVVSRQPAAFRQEHVTALLPVAEILAMAHVAQRLQVAATRHRTMESMTELTLAVSTEINSALQTIGGHCDLIDRAYPDPRLHRDVDTILRQTQRISSLLDKMRAAAHERLNEAAQGVRAGVKI
jgi:transcriptional regulator with GAF, ATPase, and Fis domain